MRMNRRWQGRDGDSGLEFRGDARLRSTGMSVQESPLNRRLLYQILGHMSRSEIWTARLGMELCLNINA